MIAKSVFATLGMLIASTTHAANVTIFGDSAGVFCLDVQGGNFSTGTPVVLEKCDLSHSFWILDTAGRLLTYNGMCLDVPGNNANRGTFLQIFDCHTGANQRWVHKNGELRGFGGADLCLDVPGSNFTSGIPVQIWDCNGTNAQSWDIE